MKTRILPYRLNIFLIMTICVLVFIALNIGPVPLVMSTAIENNWRGLDSIESLILFDIRLPRTLLAIIVGGTLGMAGAALQGLLRNPLAGPGLVGVSNCAALGAVIALYFGLQSFVWFAIPALGMLGAGISVLLIFALAGANSSITTLILAGVAVNAVASSLISLALNFAPNPYAMSEMVFWLLGSLSNRSMADVTLALPFIIVGWILILLSGRFLDALTLGEDTAKSLGFNVSNYRALLVVGIALAVGAAVSVSGNIGFVGLVVPHLLRPLLGYQPGKLLFSSALGGAILVLLADITVQLSSPNQELKLGVVTALVGGPFFLFLIIKTRNSLQ
ncbi:MAG: iron ABC transporter permease [Halioglobus sp.]|nr:iron ABC transporter permease [Halioglobus sp.]